MPAALRLILGHQVLNGVSAAFGLLLVSTVAHLWLGPLPASVAQVAAIVCIAPDAAAPVRGKLLALLPAPLFGLPLFLAVQALHDRPVLLGLLLVPATFFAFLAGAWGRRGLPIVVSIMFAVVFSLAVSQGPPLPGALATGSWFAFGAAMYLAWAVLANAALNGRYRVQMLADTLRSVVDQMRTQARQLAPAEAAAQDASPLVGQLMRQQAALADQLQAARNLLLERPRSARRRQLAGMLLYMLEMRDHLLACELDLDTLREHPGHATALATLREVLELVAGRLEGLADALVLGRRPPPAESLRPQLATVQVAEPDAAALASSLAGRIGHLDDASAAMVAMARGDLVADVAVVRAAWQLFVSPTSWSWKPLAALRRWDAPPLRHAVRASLAIGSAYALSFGLPWGTHDYWILLTIVVVLRGSLAQTLERRNSRVAGTLLGCVLAAALLWGHAPVWLLLLTLVAAQAVAHAFAVRKYLVTAVAATVLGLLQAHLLSAGGDPAFDLAERVADTLIGAGMAWIFSYVLPTWERGQVPALVRRTLAAQARHAREALGLGQFDAVDDEPELAWRLARREAYDSLSALVQATQRSLAEPRAVQPPLLALERLLAHSYQLLGQLTAVKTMLLLRRARLDVAQVRPALREAAEAIDAALLSAPTAMVGAAQAAMDDPPPIPEHNESDLTPWALRRLALAEAVASQVRHDAQAVRQALASPAA